jgi:hypothetical protein
VDLLDLLPPEHVVVPLEAPSLRAAVEQLVAGSVDTGAFRPSDDLIGGSGEHRSGRSSRPAMTWPSPITEPTTSPRRWPWASRPAPIQPRIRGQVRPRIIALVLAPRGGLALPPGHVHPRPAPAGRRFVDELARQPDAEAVRALPQLQEHHPAELTVRDVMVHRVHSVPPDATVGAAMNLMLRRRLRAVPVVGPKGEVLGMVTDSDLMRALLPQIPRVASEDPGTAPPSTGPFETS